ncbi:MAG: 5'-3' exonuclease H3TH domain-containing protein [Candidatus Dojkabacteria bacterium]|nr:MAG: 5'-3' exonuclease H3TH domain-containing protein [Candidatus Dojkabacteria bacterium]
MMRNSLLLIDGHNLLFRSYAVPFKFYSANGNPLHVVTTFLSQLRKSVDLTQPSHIAVVWDSQSPTIRNTQSAEYKANRKEDYSQEADSPFHHLGIITQVLDFLNIKHFEFSGTEADDAIATFTELFLAKNKQGRNKVTIFSLDSDFYQLLCPQVQILKIKKGEVIIYTEKQLKEDFLITPGQYILYKSLVGDASDNIKGVKRIGHKTAAKIINQEISVDLSMYEEVLAMNKKLITLNRNADILAEIEDCQCEISSIAKKNNEIFSGCCL